MAEDAAVSCAVLVQTGRERSGQ